MGSSELLRAIPSVDALLNRPLIKGLVQKLGHSLLTGEIRSVLDDLRTEILSGRSFSGSEEMLSQIESRLQTRVSQLELPSLRRVINATGVIIHTNLGRALLSKEALRAIELIGCHYSNLEYDLELGARGKREIHCERVLQQLLGVESALVVNNNAAAVMLVLNSVAEGGEVIVSRGELVEIGGSFRMPEIMTKSGAILREVGTTNRTRISDYEDAMSDRTRLILRVHRSNFRIMGFTEQPDLDELVALAHKRNIPCYEDLGSGCLVNLDRWGVKDEPTVQHSMSVGVDLCSFSGDKLLGGPQAGVIVGKEELMERLRRNPLMRVVRPDKIALAGLEATLRVYLRNRVEGDIPVLRMVAMPVAKIRRRAQRFVRAAKKTCHSQFRFSIISGLSVTGGGSAPEKGLETALVAVEHPELSANELGGRLRQFNPPIIARIEEDRVMFDLRTVLRDEEDDILAALSAL